jgi:sugar phosphate isomerase/epimerase
MMSRRDVLKFTVAGAAALAAGAGTSKVLQAAAGKPKVGVQLYSVRELCGKDLAGTVAAIGKMGYKGVEFAGYHGKSAADLRKMLDDNGLVCCGTHTAFDTLTQTPTSDNLAKTMEFNKTLGNPFLIVPHIAPKTKQEWLDKAKQFNEISDKVRPQGFWVGYHNHAAEFNPLEGEKPWDLFFGNTKKEVVMQFDTGNAMGGGGKAVDYLKQYPGRALTIHCKPWSSKDKKAVIGEDELPWNEIFEICETTGNTQWYIVEYEVGGVPPLDAVERCLAGMKKLGRA